MDYFITRIQRTLYSVAPRLPQTRNCSLEVDPNYIHQHVYIFICMIMQLTTCIYYVVYGVLIELL